MVAYILNRCDSVLFILFFLYATVALRVVLVSGKHKRNKYLYKMFCCAPYKSNIEATTNCMLKMGYYNTAPRTTYTKALQVTKILLYFFYCFIYGFYFMSKWAVYWVRVWLAIIWCYVCTPLAILLIGLQVFSYITISFYTLCIHFSKKNARRRLFVMQLFL